MNVSLEDKIEFVERFKIVFYFDKSDILLDV